jgi:hypothetical protein
MSDGGKSRTYQVFKAVAARVYKTDAARVEKKFLGHGSFCKPLPS